MRGARYWFTGARAIKRRRYCVLREDETDNRWSRNLTAGGAGHPVDLHQAVEAEVFYPPDPTNLNFPPSAISLNAGNSRAVKYGVTRD